MRSARAEDAPKLEAALFGAICAISVVFFFVIEDLADPFEGHWSVLDPSLREVQSLEMVFMAKNARSRSAGAWIVGVPIAM